MKKKSKNIKDIKSYIERYMNEDKNLCKFEIECIMKKYFNSSIYYAFAFDYEENLIIITLDNEDISTTNNLHISSFGDGLIFDILQNVFIKIEYMSFYMHYELWKEIDDKFLNIEKWRSMNKYLKYCMDNYIDKERIDKELGQEITPDVIKYYECESIFGTLKNLLEERWCKM